MVFVSLFISFVDLKSLWFAQSALYSLNSNAHTDDMSLCGVYVYHVDDCLQMPFMVDNVLDLY